MRFSERKGIAAPRVDIQRDSIDSVLRNKLWSAIHLTYLEPARNNYYQISGSGERGWAAQRLWLHFFHQPIDEIPAEWARFSAFLKEWFYSAEWYEVYDFVEALCRELEGNDLEQYTKMCNSFLESEQSAYRLIDQNVAEITSPEEIAAIESALEETSTMDPVSAHLRDALAKLTDRKAPDFRNSVKEAISAVEALARLITGQDKATLGEALKTLKDKGVRLHPALEKSWSTLYGYTSDESGIRHSLTEEGGEITFVDAKYMLVSCSAFVSYLIGLAGRSEVPLTAGRS